MEQIADDLRRRGREIKSLILSEGIALLAVRHFEHEHLVRCVGRRAACDDRAGIGDQGRTIFAHPVMNVLPARLHAGRRRVSGKVRIAGTVSAGIEVDVSGVNHVVVIDRDLLDAIQFRTVVIDFHAQRAGRVIVVTVRHLIVEVQRQFVFVAELRTVVLEIRIGERMRKRGIERDGVVAGRIHLDGENGHGFRAIPVRNGHGTRKRTALREITCRAPNAGVHASCPGRGHLVGLAHAGGRIDIDREQRDGGIAVAVLRRETGDRNRLQPVRTGGEVQVSADRTVVVAGQIAGAAVDSVLLRFVVECRSGRRTGHFRAVIAERDVAAEVQNL